jgi:proton-coupled amino acid transporter
MHYRIIATRAWQKGLDVVLVVFGFCMMTYTTALTIISWIHGVKDATPGYCDGL